MTWEIADAAPRDGTHHYMWFPYPSGGLLRRAYYDNGWHSEDHQRFAASPTHWLRFDPPEGQKHYPG